MTLYLVRHGETEWNVTRRYSGRADVPLTARGEAQARAVAELLADVRFDAFLCSPQGRALATADIIGRRLGMEAEVLDDLSEHDVGDWTGLTREQIEQRWPGELARRDADRSGYQLPGGESYASLWQRAQRVLALLRGRKLRCPLLVGHAGMGRTVAAAAARLSLADSFAIRFPNDVVYIVRDTDAKQPLSVLDHSGHHAWPDRP